MQMHQHLRNNDSIMAELMEVTVLTCEFLSSSCLFFPFGHDSMLWPYYFKGRFSFYGQTQEIYR